MHGNKYNRKVGYLNRIGNSNMDEQISNAVLSIQKNDQNFNFSRYEDRVRAVKNAIDFKRHASKEAGFKRERLFLSRYQRMYGRPIPEPVDCQENAYPSGASQHSNEENLIWIEEKGDQGIDFQEDAQHLDVCEDKFDSYATSTENSSSETEEESTCESEYCQSSTNSASSSSVDVHGIEQMEIVGLQTNPQNWNDQEDYDSDYACANEEAHGSEAETELSARSNSHLLYEHETQEDEIEFYVKFYEIFNSDFSVKPTYHETLNDLFLTSNQTCALTFNKKIISENGHTFTAYAVCKHGCKGNKIRKYRFKVFNIHEKARNLRGVIINCGSGMHQHDLNTFYRRPLRGEKRREMAKRAEKEGPKNICHANWRSATDNYLESGNFSEVPSQDVIKQCTYEKRKQEKLHNSEVEAIYLLQQKMENTDKTSRKMKGSVRKLDHTPFGVTLATESQLQIYNKLAKERKLVAHLDATGSTTKPLKRQDSKKLLHYRLLAKGESSNVPIADFISDTQNSTSISGFLGNVKSSASELGNDSLNPAILNIDMSKALLNAGISSFNRQDVSEYLQESYDVQTGRKPFNETKTVVHYCTAHYMHQVTKQSKEKASTEAIPYINGALAVLTNEESFEEQKILLRNMLTLVTSETETADVIEAKKYCEKIITKSHDLQKSTTDIENEAPESPIDSEDIGRMKSIREQSPYFKEFSNFLKPVKSNNGSKNSTDTKNVLYSPKFAEYFINNHVPYLPLITPSLMLETKCDLTQEERRLTNNALERSFGDLKTRNLKNKKNNDITKVIETLHSDTEAITRKFKFESQRQVKKKIYKSKNKTVLQKSKEKLLSKMEALSGKMDDINITNTEMQTTEEEYGKYRKRNLSLDANCECIKAQPEIADNEENWNKKTKLNNKAKKMVTFKKTITKLTGWRNPKANLPFNQNEETAQPPGAVHDKAKPKLLTRNIAITQLKLPPSNDLHMASESEFDYESDSDSSYEFPVDKENKEIRPIRIADSSYQTLDKKQWLDDTIISSAIQQTIYDSGHVDDVAPFDCVLTSDLARDNFSNTIKNLHNSNAINKDNIIFNINTDVTGAGEHWLLVDIDLNEKAVYKFNSSQSVDLSNDSKRAVENLVIAAHATAYSHVDLGEFSIYNVVDTPQQKDAHNCGMAVIKNCEHLLYKKTKLQIYNYDKERTLLKKKLHHGSIPDISAIHQKKEALQRRVETAKKNREKTKPLSWNNCQEIYYQDVKKIGKDRENEWKICGKDNECTLQSQEDQIFCCQCRKWYHYSCGNVDPFKLKKKYYLCNYCKLQNQHYSK